VRIGVVEGAGGPRSPLAVDGDTVDLVDALAPDLVVIVAEPELGVINAVRLAAAAFGSRPIVVALNRFDDCDLMHARNHDWLALRAKLDIVTSPTALAERLVP